MCTRSSETGLSAINQEAKSHAHAIAQAAAFFADAAKRGELPMTEGEFAARVKEFYAKLEAKLELSHALLLAVLSDEPCPQQLFAPWASTTTIYEWRRAAKDPLPVAILNGRVCIKPRDFFAALKRHGETKQPATCEA